MSADWQPIETADGQPIMNKRIRIRTASGREFDAKCGWFGVDEHGYDVPAWAAWDEYDAPECWTDGICWTVNEAGVESDQPTYWIPPAASPAPDVGQGARS